MPYRRYSPPSQSSAAGPGTFRQIGQFSPPCAAVAEPDNRVRPSVCDIKLVRMLSSPLVECATMGQLPRNLGSVGKDEAKFVVFAEISEIHYLGNQKSGIRR